jgi:methionyl aminopeptidase
MWAGIAAAQPGGRLGDVCAAVETEALRRGSADGIAYGIVEGYTGHGIGTQMHMDPSVPNRGRAGRGMVLKPGTCIAIEPMLTLGRRHTRLMPDDWTVVTLDGAPAAHWEHTVAVTPEGPWVLTARDGGRAALGALGVRCGAPSDGA